MSRPTATSAPADYADAFDVSRETLERLEGLVAHMDAWRGKLNLIGPKEFDRIWDRHIADSLQLLPHLPSDPKVLDLGSGGGFPGLVLAAAIEAPGSVTMVESVGKKCVFLRSAVDALSLAAAVRHARVEALDPWPVSVVTARAFAPLPKLMKYAAPFLSAGAFGLFHKGKSWQEEIAEASRDWTFAHEMVPSRTSDDGVLLKISEVQANG